MAQLGWPPGYAFMIGVIELACVVLYLLPRTSLLGAVLTGGASRRMGSDKSALEIAGQRVLGRSCQLLADRIGEVIIVGGQPGLGLEGRVDTARALLERARL